MQSTSPTSGGSALLNPFNSPTNHHRDPESPSTLLLRELQGSTHPSMSGTTSQSPTPIPRSLRHTNQYTDNDPSPFLRSSSSSDGDGDGNGDGDGDGEGGPPESIMFGESPERRSMEYRPRQLPTPQTPPSGATIRGSHLPSRTVANSFHEPGPPSSSTDSRSRSTSPGVSVYASVIPESPSTPGPSTSSRDTSTSISASTTRSATATFRQVPTFREPLSSSSTKPPPGRGTASPRTNTNTRYNDPPDIPPPKKGKGKEKEKIRKRHATFAEDDGGRVGQGRTYKGSEGEVAVGKKGLDGYERALWQWVNVEDLDGFLQEVYAYYKGKGIWCIALAKLLNLATTFFVVAFTTFLSLCIDYSKLSNSISGPNDVGRLDDVLIGQCLTRGSFIHMLFIVAVGIFFVIQLITFAFSIPRLREMYNFYTYLLGVPDADIQTLPWPEIVRLIGEIRKHNFVTSLSNTTNPGGAGGQGTKLDAHDVANRILRQENYLIALFNKDLLDLRVRLPLPHTIEHLIPSSLIAPPTSTSLPTDSTIINRERKFLSFGANTLTKALEWNLRFCLVGYLFDRRGQVRMKFIKERKKKDLVEGLRYRFIFMGLVNALLSPFIVCYLLIYSFFRYFEEYHKNPSSIGGRQYTPYAQWKFREFNELPHLFERRLDRSYPIAKEYIDQFPKEKTALVMRFVAFIAGSFAAVLLVASLIDPDLFLHFEISPHRTVLFYLGIFGSVLAIARGMIPEENLVFDPDASLREVVKWTHYLPGEWKGKLHSQIVHQEFGELFSLKITIFAQELLSVLLTPFILFFSLPSSSSAIIDFFREFTVHVDGVGYVCSFAVFDFRRNGNIKTPLSPDMPLSAGLPEVNTLTTTVPTAMTSTSTATRTTPLPQPHHRSTSNKMEKSFLHFKATHPDWQPSDPASSLFLDKLVGMHKDEYPFPIGYSGGGSIYGGRGLGVAGLHPSSASHVRHPGTMDSSRRSRSYDRAWTRSGLGDSSRPVNAGGNGSGSGLGEGKLATMKENEEDSGEDDYEEADGLGWDRRLIASGQGGGGAELGGGVGGGYGGREDDEDGGEGKGFLRDQGMMGIIQQVLKR